MFDDVARDKQIEGSVKLFRNKLVKPTRMPDEIDGFNATGVNIVVILVFLDQAFSWGVIYNLGVLS
jgi:hypothetical protein